MTAMFATLFLILFTAYLLKPARDMLILTEGTAEIRSYVVALQALLLLLLIPLYGKLSRLIHNERFMRAVCYLCALCLLAFATAGRLGVGISIPYFVWLGAYSVLIIAQFWAYASELFSREAGERIFVIVALGASIGAWLGSAASRFLVAYTDAYGLILCGVCTLLLASLASSRAASRVPDDSRGHHKLQETEHLTVLAGFHLVLRKPYLLLLALFVIGLNLVNTTGEYLLAAILEELYKHGLQEGSIFVDKATYIGQFYSQFYFMVNLTGVLIQYFLVSRLIRVGGFGLAFVLTPMIVFAGYGLMSVLPLIAWFSYYKIAENSLDYSLQNTTRQILYLPFSRQEKYEARAVIDTLGQRLGDLLQAGVIYAGLHWLQFKPLDFIVVAAVLAGINFLISINIIRYRRHLFA